MLGVKQLVAATAVPHQRSASARTLGPRHVLPSSHRFCHAAASRALQHTRGGGFLRAVRVRAGEADEPKKTFHDGDAVTRDSRTYRPQPQPSQDSMREETQQMAMEIARYYYEMVWSKGKLDTLPAVMDDDHIQDDRIWGQGKTSVGREKMGNGIAFFRSAFPDLTFEVLNIACTAENQVFVQWHATGTQTGDFGSKAADGSALDMHGVSLVQFSADSGKISRSTVYRQVSDQEKAMHGNANA